MENFEPYVKTLESRIRDLEIQIRNQSSSVIKSPVEPDGSFEVGQYWYDQRNSSLKIWDGTKFADTASSGKYAKVTWTGTQNIGNNSQIRVTG